MRRVQLFALTTVILAVVILTQCLFIVQATQKALVLQLGEQVGKVREPGINFKLPFIQNVVYIDQRIQVFEIPKTYSLTADLKTFEIDNYACWRITDPTLYYKNLRTETVAEERLKNIVYSQLRAAIGSKDLKEVVYTKRNEIMDEVLFKSNKQAEDYGVSIIDVRIKRTDLPNRDAIFRRMNAERTRMAKKYRSEGESENLRIRSEAELQRDFLIATANRQSIITRGNAEAKAMSIFNEALSSSPDFYEFTKSLDIYRNSLKNSTKIIFSTEDPILRHMN